LEKLLAQNNGAEFFAKHVFVKYFSKMKFCKMNPTKSVAYFRGKFLEHFPPNLLGQKNA